MYPITTVWKGFGITRNTARNWTQEFADFLSSSANPPEGEAREYTEDDLRVLALVAHMRQQNATYDTIRAALAAGERREFIPLAAGEDEDDQEASTAIVTRLVSTVARFEGELTAVKGERDRLLGELESERAARLQAEKEAARLQGMIEGISQQQARPSFWQRLRGSG